MKRACWLLVFICGNLFGQELDSLMTDSVTVDSVIVDSVEVKIPKTHWAAALEAVYTLAPNPGGKNALVGLGGTLEYKKWSMAILAQQFNGEIISIIVFPNSFSLDYKYLEFSLGYNVFRSKLACAWVSTSYSSGEIIWRNVKTNEAFEKGKLDLVKFGGLLEFSGINIMRPFIHFGIQTAVSNPMVNDVDQSDLNGTFIGVGIKLGYFNR